MNANETMRRRLVWAAVLLLVVGVAGWFTYHSVAESRREEARQREDDERLRMARYQDVLRNLEAIGDDGDEKARAKCRQAIELLAQMDPYQYQVYRSVRPAPGWLVEPPAEKQ